MLEYMLSGFHTNKNIINNVTPKKVLTTSPRSNGACEIIGDEILFMGGQAGGANPYPSNGFKINVNTGVVTNVSGYDGTWTCGCAIGNNVWIAMGHNGSANNYIKYRAATAFGASQNFSSGKPGRHAGSMDAYNSDKILWGMGRGNTSSLSDCYMYTISSNTWSTLSNCPIPCNTNTSGRFGSDGKFYCIDANEGSNMLRYDPVANTWSRVSSYVPVHFSITNASLGNSAIRSVGHYLFFTVSHTWKGVDNRLSLLRYDVDTGVYVLIPLNKPGLLAPGLVYHQSSRTLMIVSGLIVPYTAAYDYAPRSTEILVYDIDDLTRPV